MCGASLEEVASRLSSAGSKPCPFCGELNDDLVFCRFCGKKMSAGKAAASLMDDSEGAGNPPSDTVPLDGAVHPEEGQDFVRHESFAANIGEIKPESSNDAVQSAGADEPGSEESREPEKFEEPEPAPSEEEVAEPARRTPVKPLLRKILIFSSLTAVLFLAGLAIGLAAAYILKG